MVLLMISTLLSTYFRYPKAFWAGQSAMQRELLETILSRQSDLSPSALARYLLDGVERREKNVSSVLHIANMGSSGSHWLERLLAGASGATVAREIYIPIGLRVLTPLDRLRKPLIEALALLYADCPIEDALQRSLIHSGHTFSVSPEPDRDARFQRVLLVRDPLSIVMSRTFRKERFRARIAPGATDREYLGKNIRIVNRFYSRATRRGVSATVCYEDLVEQPEATVMRLLDTLHWPVEVEKVRATVRSAPPKPKGRNASAEAAPTIPPELRALAIEELSGLRARLGYA